MSTMFSRALMVLRSLSLRTHAFALCVITGTLLLCMGFFAEPNIDSRTTTNVEMEMETASASYLSIDISVESLTATSDADVVPENVIELNQVSVDDIESTDSVCDVSFEDYLEFARLVEAEASTEDLQGKCFVADVVMNRVASDIFPDRVTEVINDPGQFDPVTNKYINYAEPSHDAKQAVMNALNCDDSTGGALYFQKSKAEEWGDKLYLFRYGSHSFYK